MRPDLPSGAVTFLFTDVEGSTRLLHELGAEAYADALAEHRALIREACSAEGGVEVDTQGDAFFFAFPEAEGAVAAASTFIGALAPTPIRVRVGLHTGEPLLTSEGYVGEDVHFAARVAAAGHGGQVVVSAAAAEALEDSSSLSQALSALGAHRLKDIAEPVSLYQLGEGSFPPLKTIANTNLPTPASRFLGREHELYEADALLERTRLLTITGPGGQGKTRFALELARRAREERFSEYEDGVFACFFSSLRDPALVLPTIAHTLSVSEQAGTSALEGLAAHLQGRKLLLVLDNLEHLLAAARELSQLLEACSGLTLLVTSRELLRVSGEEPYALPPLPADEAVALFCERSRSAPTPAIASLCARLEGLPLAIELAAARTAILTPDQLEQRLSKRLDLLKAGRDADPRQQTLRATIEWSYDLLSHEEQRLFARLAVFQGGCTLEAAEEVCEADLDLLQSLVDKSLLRRRDTELGPRFWMLETIRELAEERLGESGEAGERRQQHAEWARGLVREAESGMQGPDGGIWLARLGEERDNVRAALAFAEQAKQTDTQLELVGGVWEFWDYVGAYDEGLRWTEAALAASSGARTALRAGALRTASLCAGRTGDLERSRTFADESLAIFRELGDTENTAWALNICGVVRCEAGNEIEAEPFLEQARAEAAAAGVDRVAAIATLNLGELAFGRGDYARARERSVEALALFRRIGDVRQSAWALHNLAFSLLRSGCEAEALQAARESLTVGGDMWVRISTLVLLASVEDRQGEPDRAARLLGAALGGWDRLDIAPTGSEGELARSLSVDLRAKLGGDRYEAACSEGRSMSVEDAVAYALASLE